MRPTEYRYHKVRRARLDLTSVMPLLEYLHALPQDSSDRPLSWAEDEQACDILLALPLPEEMPRLACWVPYYANFEYRQSRTLSVWYGIARAVARMIQDGD